MNRDNENEESLGQLPTVDEARDRLSAFFELNHMSTIEGLKNGVGELEIANPWGDSSLSLIISEDFDNAAQALNAVLLPEKFSALWHADTKKLEVIWTALKLPEPQKEIEGRAFSFLHNGVEHKCHFGTASERLLVIAKLIQPTTISETNHRNMLSFSAYVDRNDDVAAVLDNPRSFWIECVEWEESNVVEMINHLNFYMRYYDGLSPTVLIHSSSSDPVVPIKTRYVKGSFPSFVESSPVDENLLSFWSFADGGNPMLRFLLYYRILEYAAFHFIDDSIKCDLKKLIMSPDLKSDVGRSIESMVSAMGASKLSDAQKLRALCRASIQPATLWRDLESNKDFFIKDTAFDGGFIAKSPIAKNDTADTFGMSGVERLADRFRDIRNALSHGKDQEKGGVIRPTPINGTLFLPWVHLIATAAGEVVLYKDAT